MAAIGLVLFMIGYVLKVALDGDFAYGRSTDGWWVLTMLAGLLLTIASVVTWLWRVMP